MTCRFPNCPRPAAVVARIAMVGDRATCSWHLTWMTDNGMAFRLLDADAPVPEWRQRGLAKVLDHGKAVA